MAYQVLALKWRPQVFEDLVGQEAVARTLKNAIQQGRIAHAFLFSGVRGVGKTTSARILAKALNCASGPTVRPCGACPACQEIAASGSLDVMEIDAASNNSVEQWREIIEGARYAPSRDRFKIYIIDEVHMLSGAAFNALLKTLEEPPPRVKFIFATTEYHKIPDTILSRCQQFELRTLTRHEITRQLARIAEAEAIDISSQALGQIAGAAEGSLRDALSALDQVVAALGTRVTDPEVSEVLGLIDRRLLAAAARAVVEQRSGEIFAIVDQLVRGGRDLQRFTRGLMQYFRDVLVSRVAPQATELIELAGDSEEINELKQLASRLSEEDLLRFFDLLAQAEGALRWAPEPRFHLEVALVKLAHLQHLVPFEELLARLESGGGPGAAEPSSEPRPSGGGTSGSAPPGPRRSSRSAVEPSPPARTLPEEAAPAQPEGGASEQALLDALLERARTAKPKLSGLLSRRSGMRLCDDRLIISFAPGQELIREQVEQADSRRLIEQWAAELAGRPLRLEMAISPRVAEAAAKQSRPEQASLRERALREPLVQAFLTTMQGEVEEVRALGRSREASPSAPGDEHQPSGKR
jgi:DNA polymerase-3 subunit gamma/tau